jgi:hypothetical protein
MANEKVKIVGEIKIGNGWYNFKDEKDREIGINEAKNPKLKPIMDLAKDGDTIEGNVSGKDGKFYMWDPKDSNGAGGGKKFTPRDKSFDAALAAANATAILYANRPKEDQKSIPAAFQMIHDLIMSKATVATKED